MACDRPARYQVPMTNRPRVALLVETSGGYGRQVLAGVAHYSRLNGPWSFYVLPRGHEQSLPDMQHWRGTGIIARIESKTVADAIAEAGVPTIGLDVAPEILRALRRKLSVSEMHPDPKATARLALEHLIERGFRSFAFVGVQDQIWSQEREDAFVQAVAGQPGLTCAKFNLREGTRARRYGLDQQNLTGWLKKLPRPIGLMTCNDDCGREVLDAARLAELAVPDEMAVIGVDNDEVLCDLCNPPLSSVMPNARRAGYEAAALLDRMMAGESVPAQTILVEPLGVATRHSTDVVAISDPKVSAAVRFIRDHANDRIDVSDVLKAVPMSRTLLERAFKQHLGRTPHEQITHVKIDRVKLLLTTTDLSLALIAERTGFDHVEYVSVSFKRVVGCTPSEYRAQHRPQAKR